MLAISRIETKENSTKVHKKPVPTNLQEKEMGGQFFSKVKPSSIEESFSSSCSLECNEILRADSITPRKENVKRSRKTTKADSRQAIPKKKLKISMLYEDYETRNSFMAAFFKLLGEFDCAVFYKHHFTLFITY